MTKKRNLRNAWNVRVVVFGECSDGCDEAYYLEKTETLFAASKSAAIRKAMESYNEKCERLTKESSELDPYEYRQYSVECVFVKHASESRTDGFTDPVLGLTYNVWEEEPKPEKRFWFSWENQNYKIVKRFDMILAESRKEALRSFKWKHASYDHIPTGTIVSCEDLASKRMFKYAVKEGNRYTHVNNVR